MSRHTESDRSQATYRTYDGRQVSRESIQRVLRQLEASERRRAHWELLRTWGLLLTVTLILAAASVILIWRLSLGG